MQQEEKAGRFKPLFLSKILILPFTPFVKMQISQVSHTKNAKKKERKNNNSNNDKKTKEDNLVPAVSKSPRPVAICLIFP